MLFLLIAAPGWAQDVTRVSGTVINAQTKEPLPFVNINFKNSYTGTATDLDGKFSLQTRFPTDSLVASFIGYISQTLAVTPDIRQELSFELESTALTMETVTVKAKKEKYRRKNNPAVDLIKKVMDNKKQNSLKGQEHYSFEKYEKIELDLNNITEQFKDRKLLRPFKFIFEYVDTSKINGRPYLPMFLKETRSKVYYRKSPSAEKEYRSGVKMTKFDETIDEKSVDDVVDLLYQNIDIYENTVHLLGNQFLSPVAPLAPVFYRFYIIDTLDFQGQSVINLAFIPRNKSNLGFTGNLFISNDDEYSIRKVDLGVIGGINLNFIRDLRIIQEFKPLNDAFVLAKDQLTIDYSITKNGIGFFGTRTVLYDEFSFEAAEDPSVYGGIENIVTFKDAYDKGDDYWLQSRLEPLNENERGLYEMIDSLQNLKAYQNVVTAFKIITTGYVPGKKVDIGPVLAFSSFNDVEGFRLRFGGETNFNFSKRLLIAVYGAYGFRDEAFKYSGEMTYTFNEDYRVNPRHYINLSYAYETSFPGQQLQFINEDNFLLSFKRGVTDRMLFSRKIRADYVNEGETFDYSFFVEHQKMKPYGTLSFPFSGDDGIRLLESVNLTEIGIGFRFAPNQQFVQGRQYRIPIFNKYPVFWLQYQQGIPEFMGGEHEYYKLFFNAFKRFHWSVFGHTNVEMEAGKIWGEVPYILYHLPRANQTYAYQLRAYNMMNFMEFISDEFVSFNVQHFFMGYIFNKIPLLKKLKLREVVTAKVIWGNLTDQNNPNLHPHLVQFPVDENGDPVTFILDGKPYLEASFGVMNIFRFLRVDFVKRFTYLDNPNIPSLWGVNGLGIRIRFKVEF